MQKKLFFKKTQRRNRLDFVPLSVDIRRVKRSFFSQCLNLFTIFHGQTVTHCECVEIQMTVV